MFLMDETSSQNLDLLFLRKCTSVIVVSPRRCFVKHQNSSFHTLEGSSANANFFLSQSAPRPLCKIRLCFAAVFLWLVEDSPFFVARLSKIQGEKWSYYFSCSKGGGDREKKQKKNLLFGSWERLRDSCKLRPLISSNVKKSKTWMARAESDVPISYKREAISLPPRSSLPDVTSHLCCAWLATWTEGTYIPVCQAKG